MGILLIIFAVAIGYATFIENDYDATTARVLIYNARWFEVLMLLMVINFSGMIFTRQLYRKDKLNILVIHISLVIIILGAALTRYLGSEGMMHIRNGQVSNTFISADTYISITSPEVSFRDKIMLSVKAEDFYQSSMTLGSEKIDLKISRYYDNAIEKVVRTPEGLPQSTGILSLIVQGPEETQTIYLKRGESKSINDLGISFGDTTISKNIHIVEESGGLLIRLPLDYQSDKIDSSGRTHSKYVPLKQMARYKFYGMTLVLHEYIESGILKYGTAENENQKGERIIDVVVNDVENSFKVGQSYLLQVGDQKAAIRIGAMVTELPFSIHLKEFQLDRYPGSNSPSSFASEIVLIDKRKNLIQPYRIFMNNILSYEGYRFYQSSYDPDEQGTVLSVNDDYWGTNVTYVGYFLLFSSLIFSFFTPKTRFARLLKKFENVRAKRQSITISIFLFFFLSVPPHLNAQHTNARLPIVTKEHAEKFGKLQVQNPHGRMMPVNTMASDVLVKIYKKDTYEGLTADQVFLEMIVSPFDWMMKPLVKIGDDELKELLGVTEDYARYIDFFSRQGVYKINEQVNEAYRKKPALRSKFDKELIYVDERVNVFTMITEKTTLRIFPLSHLPNDAWGTPTEFEATVVMLSLDSLFSEYQTKLLEAKVSNDYSYADEMLSAIDSYQKTAGQSVILSDNLIQMEVFYNQSDIFKRLFPIYLTLGVLLSALFFTQVFKPSVKVTGFNKTLAAIVMASFAFHTFGLILRWYISGHAPWSNGYESMLYISWVTVLSGLIFMNKSQMALAVSTMLAGVTLLTAHMSWMNPEITNLVPVLKSYWLTIHVATITASYGFLGLGAMLGFMNLCLMIFRSTKNQQRVNLILSELSIIIEMSLIVGLVLLIIGNFLGGIWANESWGRYWGWDPKETWTLVTIIAYSFILHMRLVPGLKGQFSFNFFSLIAFGTVLMTYFGVNFYLSGLHSYAKGDPVPIPTFVYYIVGIILFVSALAAINGYRLNPLRTRSA